MLPFNSLFEKYWNTEQLNVHTNIERAIKFTSKGCTKVHFRLTLIFGLNAKYFVVIVSIVYDRL